MAKNLIYVEIINGEKFDLLFFLKELKYKGDYNLLEQKDIPFYVEILSESLKYPIFQGYISKGYEILSKFLDNKSDSDKFVKEAIKANPYSKLNPERAPLVKNRNLLFRIVKTPTGDIKVDFTYRANGRGAYISKNKEAIENAKKKKLLSRALECNIDDEIYDYLLTLVC